MEWPHLPSLGQRYNYQLSDHFVNNKRGLEFKIIDIYHSKGVELSAW